MHRKGFISRPFHALTPLLGDTSLVCALPRLSAILASLPVLASLLFLVLVRFCLRLVRLVVRVRRFLDELSGLLNLRFCSSDLLNILLFVFMLEGWECVRHRSHSDGEVIVIIPLLLAVFLVDLLSMNIGHFGQLGDSLLDLLAFYSSGLNLGLLELLCQLVLRMLSPFLLPLAKPGEKLLSVVDVEGDFCLCFSVDLGAHAR
eukprot:m.70103 g.70103  ORF g.70103 m.70103 type:complete len:203 (+) comp50111_c0_seq2:114-722(+)